MFDVGDFIIYGSNGVCKVTDVGPMKMPGIPKDKLYYTMVPCYIRDSEIFTPVDNERVVMRKVMSKDEAEDFISSMPDIGELEIIEEKKRELGMLDEATETEEGEETRECSVCKKKDTRVIPKKVAEQQ